MNTQKREPAPLHLEVILGLLLAGVILLAGLLVTVLIRDWTPVAIGSVVGAGVLFVALCIPQIKAASEAKREGDEE